MSNHLTVNHIQDQEESHHLTRFDADVAFKIGSIAREIAEDQYPDSTVVIDITTTSGATLFRTAIGNPTSDNEDWIRRKRNTAIRFEQSSLRFGKTLAAKGRVLADRFLDSKDYASDGGAFPIKLHHAPDFAIAVLTVSGLADYEDHQLAVEAIEAYLS